MVEGVLVPVEHGVVVQGSGAVHLLGVPTQRDAALGFFLKQIRAGYFGLDDGLCVKDECWHSNEDFKLGPVVLLNLHK